MKRAWKFYVDFVNDCKTVVIPLVLVLAASAVAFILEASHFTLFVISQGGTLITLLGNAVYILIREQRRTRCPAEGCRQRRGHVGMHSTRW